MPFDPGAAPPVLPDERSLAGAAAPNAMPPRATAPTSAAAPRRRALRRRRLGLSVSPVWTEDPISGVRVAVVDPVARDVDVADLAGVLRDHHRGVLGAAQGVAGDGDVAAGLDLDVVVVRAIRVTRVVREMPVVVQLRVGDRDVAGVNETYAR